jgi:S-adenosylmethionine synthetase
MFLKIKNQDGSYISVPKVSSISVSSNKIVESARNDNGDMFHELISEKRSVSVGFAPLTEGEKQVIYDLTAQESGLNLDIKFHDPETHNDEETMSCYIGDRSIAIALTKDGEITLWDGLSLTFTEN